MRLTQPPVRRAHVACSFRGFDKLYNKIIAYLILEKKITKCGIKSTSLLLNSFTDRRLSDLLTVRS